eukprot:m.60055 g.60055  ORF g.60055 m.60055 type:complete len:213 (-) comp22793_c0_seq2:205-843(-)
MDQGRRRSSGFQTHSGSVCEKNTSPIPGRLNAFDPQLHQRMVGLIDSLRVPNAKELCRDRAEIGACLLLGSLDHALEILENSQSCVGVAGVINLFGGVHAERIVGPEYRKLNIAYLGINAEDEEGYPLLDTHIMEVLDFVKKESPKGRVLIHCREGKNRSATMCVAVLMCLEKFTLEDAVAHVLSKRPIALTNKSFINQLVTFSFTCAAMKV